MSLWISDCLKRICRSDAFLIFMKRWHQLYSEYCCAYQKQLVDIDISWLAVTEFMEQEVNSYGMYAQPLVSCRFSYAQVFHKSLYWALDLSYSP